MLRKVKRFFRDAYIKECEINPKYVIFPPSEEIQEESKPATEPKVAGLPSTENPPQIHPPEELEKILEDLSYLREKVDSLSELNKNLEGLDVFFRIANPETLEKFLISIGILIGGLFLFTWILILWVYRKVGVSNIENVNLINDLFKLLKVLSLLNKGYTVKMNEGKILIYDEKEDRWKEAE
jgi:hypothetical protein